MLAGIVVFACICVLAVAGYMSAGWELTDSIYMVVITIFGVGYGEVQPVKSTGLRILTISVIVSGYAAVIYTVGGFMQFLIDGELNKVLGARRMTKGIERLQGHTIICGLGRLGINLVKELDAAGKPFVVIDQDVNRLQGLEEAGHLIIQGDATEEDILEQAGIRRAAVIASVLPTDSTNVFVTITARELNPKITIIARGENPRTERKLLGCGASRVVMPTAIGAQRMAQLIIRPTAEDMLEQMADRRHINQDLSLLGIEMSEIRIDEKSPLIDCPIGEIEAGLNQGLLIVGIRHADGRSVLHPPITTKLCVGDIIVFLGHSNEVASLTRKLGKPGHELTYRGVKVKPHVIRYGDNQS